MIKKRSIGKHERKAEQATPLHLTLKSRATAALTAGCLALSMCPVIAFAAPNANASQQNESAAVEQQMPNGGQQPNGQQPPSRPMMGGQQPAGGQPFGGWLPSDGQQLPSGEPAGEQPSDGRQTTSENWQMPDGEQAPMGPGADGDDSFAADAAPSGDQQPNGEEQGGAKGAPGDLSNGQPPLGDQSPMDGQQPSGGQTPVNGQEPSGDQTPSSDQQPPSRDEQNQPSDRQGQHMNPPADNSAVDAQVRDILTDKYGAPTQMPEKGCTAENGNNGVRRGKDQFINVNDIPAVPEGEANVQEVIDTTRDIVREYGADALEKADFSDKQFTSELAEIANNAVEQRAKLFRNGEQPGDVTSSADTSKPDDAASANDTSNDGAQSAPAKPTNENVSSSVLDQIIGFLAGFFGFGSK